MSKLIFDENKTYQTFTGIGASGAWWAQLVGKWNSVTPDGTLTKDKIASLLYDKAEGIGMSIYRYNLGGGSAESKKGKFSDEERRAECFESDEGKYDFSKDAAAVYMMKKCVECGSDEVIFFVNSPIERLTKNHLAHCSSLSLPIPFIFNNLPEKNISNFAKYCLDVTEHFVNEGVPVKYISPINEPLWVWSGGQEGCHYSAKRAAKTMKTFAQELDKRPSLKNIKLSGLENGDIRWFNRIYTNALMKYECVRNKTDSVDIHSYFLPIPVPFTKNRIAFLKRWRKFLDKKYPGLPVKVSEWCHMQGGKDTGMNSALVMANVMYEDFVYQNASSWQHWIACSCYDYCDGLIYIDDKNQTFELTKRYYATGNFSKYIPKGAVRIDAKFQNLKTICFKFDKKIISVIINDTEKAETFEYDGDFLFAVTDVNNNLAETKYTKGDKAIIPEKSVCTVIIDY